MVSNVTRAIWILSGVWLIWVGWMTWPGDDPRITKSIILVGVAELAAALTPWRPRSED